MVKTLSPSRARVILLGLVTALVVALCALAPTAGASTATSCYNYSFSHGGGGCSWQSLYRNRWGTCQVYRAVGATGYFGQIWAMTPPCTNY